MAITNLVSAPKLFVGQGDLIIFDEISDYGADGVGLASLTNPKSLGQIVEDSSSWTGDDVSFDEIRDEQGDLITSTVTNGTMSFEFDIAALDPGFMSVFLKASTISSAALASVFGGTGTTVTAVGWGDAVPVITRPIGWLNEDLKRLLLFPKAKIAANLANADKLMRIHCVATAEYLDLATLKTAMLFDSSAAASYEA